MTADMAAGAEITSDQILARVIDSLEDDKAEDIVTIDLRGRSELADFMAKQGCTMAYNLDGGNSALMWFGGENYSEKTVKAERSVSDIIYFATAIDAANTEE